MSLIFKMKKLRNLQAGLSETVSRHKRWCYCIFNLLQHWVEERGLIYFCKVDHSRITRNFPGTDFVSIMYVKYWGFWIYPGPENIGVTQAECVWISLNNSWICLIISEYVEMSNTNLTLLPPVSLRSQFSIFENSARKNLHCFRKTLYRRCLTGL